MRQKPVGIGHAPRINSMAKPGHAMGFAGNSRSRERAFGRLQRAKRNDGVFTAMGQQNYGRLAIGAPRVRLMKPFWSHQQAGKTNNEGRNFAPQPHMKRHHGALRKSNQRKGALINPMAFQLSIQKSVQRRARFEDTLKALLWAEGCKGKPLAPRGRQRARLRRIGRDKSTIGQNRAPMMAKINKIAAIGSIAVKKDDELFGVA